MFLSKRGCGDKRGMIDSIDIKNFQSHKKTKILFKKGLNVITGPSDSGKSSVIRAILWVANNRPSGDAIRNWDCSDKDETRVEMKMDGVTVSKSRKQNKTFYYLEDSRIGAESICYEAVNKDVPERISEEINMTEFNVQTQHQSYFLLNDSGGDIAGKLNDLVGLNVIDTLFKNLNSGISDTNRELKEIDAGIESANDGLEKLSYLDDALKKMEELFVDTENFEKISSDILFLERVISAYEGIQEEIDEAKPLLDNEEKVKALLAMVGDYERTLEEYDWISEIKNKYEVNKKLIGFYAKEIDGLEKDYKELLQSNMVCPLLGVNCKELKNYGRK